MSFIPDLRSDFFQKTKQINHPKIYFNNARVFCVDWQKHLGIYLDESLNFSYHINEKMSKAMKETGIIGNLIKDFLNILLSQYINHL